MLKGNLESHNISLQLGFNRPWAPLETTFRSAPVSLRDPLLFSTPVSVRMNQKVPVSPGCSLLAPDEAGLLKWFLIPALFSRSRHSTSQGIISAHSPRRVMTYETGPSGFLIVTKITRPCSFHLLHVDTTITEATV